jgi:hypothetical protein
MAPCQFLYLPEAVARFVMVEWLGLRQVNRLDLAFCCSELRPLFETLAFGRFTTYSVNWVSCGFNIEAVLRWSVARNVQLNDLRISDHPTVCDDVMQAFLANSGSTVHSLDVVGDSDDCAAYYRKVLEIAESCPNVQSLRVLGGPEDRLWDDCIVGLTKTLLKLSDLFVGNTPLTNQGLATALLNCSSLKSLTVTSLHQTIPVEIALPTLTTMTLQNCHVSDSVMVAIGQRCVLLEVLKVFGAFCRGSEDPYSDAGVRAVLEGCPLLRETDVEYARGISAELRVELAGRGNLKTFSPRNWSGMHEGLAHKVLQVSPNLTDLDCSHCEWLTDATLAMCAQHCKLLEVVNVEECRLVTNTGVQELVSGVGRSLRVVNIQAAFLARLSDEAVQAVAQHCPLLERLECPPRVPNETMIKLAKGCPNLMYLNLGFCDVCDSGLTALGKHCPKLIYLELYGCRLITRKGVGTLRLRYPLLEIIGVYWGA